MAWHTVVLYSTMLLVAVLPFYARGVRLAAPGRELCGELVIERAQFDKTTVARLYHSGGGSCLIKDGGNAMELYEPVVKQLVRGRLDLRGMARVDTAWHLQLWNCRLITSVEHYAMQRTSGAAPSGMFALYLRWWAAVWEAVARQDGPRRYCDVAEMPDLLEAPLEEVWPFVEWAGRTARGLFTGGGKDNLGSLEVRFLEPRLLEGTHRVVVEAALPLGAPRRDGWWAKCWCPPAWRQTVSAMSPSQNTKPITR